MRRVKRLPPGGAVFATACSVDSAERSPILPIHDWIGGSGGAGGDHLQEVDGRHRHKGAYSTGVARKSYL